MRPVPVIPPGQDESEVGCRFLTHNERFPCMKKPLSYHLNSGDFELRLEMGGTLTGKGDPYRGKNDQRERERFDLWRKAASHGWL